MTAGSLTVEEDLEFYDLYVQCVEAHLASGPITTRGAQLPLSDKCSLF